MKTARNHSASERQGALAPACVSNHATPSSAPSPFGRIYSARFVGTGVINSTRDRKERIAACC